jgi:DNA-binding CsgD family transcriptional regulator
MDQLQPDGIRKSPAPDFFQSLILEQRGTTEELKALCKELQTLLDDLESARPDLRLTLSQLMVERNHQEAPVRHSKAVPQEMTLAQCKRESERNLMKSTELIRESGQIRQRSKAMRAALRGATPRRSRLAADRDGFHVLDGRDGHHAVDGKDGWHALDGKDGHHALDGKDGHRGKTRKDAPNREGLSRREFEVLRLMVDGMTSREAAAELGISFKTAVTHRASIMSKLDVHEIASVVREAIHRGLV